MSPNKSFSARQLGQQQEEEIGPRTRRLVVIAILWWVVAYFLLGFLLTDVWWQRDLLASAPLIIISLFAPTRIKGLAICVALWALISHLTHDVVFAAFYPADRAIFSNELLLWLVSWVPGIIVGAFVIAALILPHAWFASEFVLAFRGIAGLSRWEAIRALMAVSFGFQLPYAIIENGQETITKPKGLLTKIGGPGLVVIRPASAAVYERHGKITQIVGPGRAYTKLFEFKKGIVQLRPRALPLEADDVMTKDGVALRVKGGVSARIESAERTRELIQAAENEKRKYAWAWSNPECRNLITGDFPVYKDSVFRAIYYPAGSNWEESLPGAALKAVRDAVGKRRLEDIFGDPSDGVAEGPDRPASVLEKEAKTQLDTWIHEWGIQIGGVGISVLAPPEEVQEKVRRRWKTAAERANIEQIGQAEAGALHAIEGMKKKSFDDMTQALQTAIQQLTRTYGEEGSLRFQEILTTIAANVGRDSTTTLRYIEALEKLSNHPNAHIIIAPGSQNISVEQRE